MRVSNVCNNNYNCTNAKNNNKTSFKSNCFVMLEHVNPETKQRIARMATRIGDPEDTIIITEKTYQLLGNGDTIQDFFMSYFKKGSVIPDKNPSFPMFKIYGYGERTDIYKNYRYEGDIHGENPALRETVSLETKVFLELKALGREINNSLKLKQQ